MTSIDPTARIDKNATIGKNVSIGPYCVIGPDVRLGDDCKLTAHVVISGRTTIGPRTVISPFASLGSPPQSVHYHGEATSLEIGADCIIRECVTMNIGTAGGKGATKVGDHCFFMAYSHVGHDCVVGNHVVFANCVPLGGFVEIGDFVFLGGMSAVHQFTRVGSYAMIAASTMVTQDVIPYAYAAGTRVYLAGINRIGLTRGGFSRDDIHKVRRAYLSIFMGSGTLAERVEQIARERSDDKFAMRMIEFIRAGKSRHIATPRGSAGDAP
jgi:UDP-N-acetylglucosamine acyltransferase